MQRITIKDLGNTDAWGNELTDAQKKDFMFLLENVQAAETILAHAVKRLGECPHQPKQDGMPADLAKMSKKIF